MSHIFAIYLRDVIPFRFAINPSTSDKGFLFGDEKPWPTEKLTDVLKDVTAKHLGVSLTNRDFRQIIVAIDRRHVRPGEVNDDEDDDDDEESNPHDIMSVHSGRTVNNWYGQLKNPTQALSPESMDLFRKISNRWHQWLGLLSRIPRNDDNECEEGDEDGDVTIAEEVNGMIESKYGAGFIWRCPEQRELVMKICEGASPLVGVMPTSAGKTEAVLMATMLPRAKTTVFITPLRALAKRMLDSCRKRGMDVIMFGESKLRPAKLLIVVTESIRNKALLQYFDKLYVDNLLDRIVIDEAHMLISEKSYRNDIDFIKNVGLPVQFVYLTATLPPCLQTMFENEIIFCKPEYVRAEIQKPNIQYMIKTIPDRMMKKQAKEMILKCVTEYGSEGKVIVFCKTKGECDEVGRLVNCATYYRTKDDSILDEWSEGCLIATSIIGAGMNFENIREVFHFGIPYGAMDFEQQVGRGGRRGEKVRSTILLSESEYEELRSNDPDKMMIDKAIMREIVIAEECRRNILSGYLNGSDSAKRCADISGYLCDICLADDGNTELRKRQREIEEMETQELSRAHKKQRRSDAVIENNMSIARTWEFLGELVDEIIKDKCSVCWLVEQDYNHMLKDCRYWIRIRGFSGHLIREPMGLNYKNCGNTSVCWTCGFPGDRCPDYRERGIRMNDGEEDVRRCLRKDVVIPMVIAAFQDRKLGYSEAIKETAGRGFSNLRELGSWGGLQKEIMGDRGSNVFRLWVNIVKIRKERENSEKGEESQNDDESDGDIYG